MAARFCALPSGSGRRTCCAQGFLRGVDQNSYAWQLPAGFEFLLEQSTYCIADTVLLLKSTGAHGESEYRVH